jgi:hypothetical protein
MLQNLKKFEIAKMIIAAERTCFNIFSLAWSERQIRETIKLALRKRIKAMRR